MASTGKRVGFFSLETDAQSLTDRLMAETQTAAVALPKTKQHALSNADYSRTMEVGRKSSDIYLRIIRKAEAKLHGTLAADIMYGDAKDREFLRTHGDFHLADFLQLAAAARSDRQRLVSAVLNAMRSQDTPHPGVEQDSQAG